MTTVEKLPGAIVRGTVFAAGEDQRGQQQAERRQEQERRQAVHGDARTLT